MNDYGTAWRVMRPSSITDQVYIKALRVRCIEEKGIAKINEGIIPEMIGIVNYAIMGLVQLQNKPDVNFSPEEILELYHAHARKAKQLMLDKNHDYDEAWRLMRVTSYTDLILMKIHRVKQIEDNEGSTIISEGVDANYLDIINYAVFALVRLLENGEKTQN
jgi:hypothetical protein